MDTCCSCVKVIQYVSDGDNAVCHLHLNLGTMFQAKAPYCPRTGNAMTKISRLKNRFVKENQPVIDFEK